MPEDEFRIRIDGAWSAKEMGELFASLDAIYKDISRFHSLQFYREVAKQSNDPLPVGNSDGRDLLLKVTQVSYSSPGWADFLGAGEVMGHLKDFVLGIIDRILERKDRALDRQLRSVEIEAAALENYSKRLEIMDKTFDLTERTDLTDGQRQQLLTSMVQSMRVLGKAAAEGRIRSVEDLPDKDPSKM